MKEKRERKGEIEIGRDIRRDGQNEESRRGDSLYNKKGYGEKRRNMVRSRLK